MYVTDLAIAKVSVNGLTLDNDSGVVWKVTRGNRTGIPGGLTLIFAGVCTLLLGLSTLVASGLLLGAEWR